VGAGVTVAVGVCSGVSVGVGVPVDVGVGDPLAGVAVGDGSGVGMSQTAKPGLIWFPRSRTSNVGGESEGMLRPPTRYAVVPVGETYTALEFFSLALVNVQGREQKTVGVIAGTAAPQFPDEEFPRRSKRMVIGNCCVAPGTIATSQGSVKSTVRVSTSGVNTPSRF